MLRIVGLSVFEMLVTKIALWRKGQRDKVREQEDEKAYRNAIAMPFEGLEELRLGARSILDVPNAYPLLLPSADEILAISADGQAPHFILMAFDWSSIGDSLSFSFLFPWFRFGDWL